MFDRYDIDQGRVQFDPNPTDHSGKGPVRSDERIHDAVCDALARHPELDASGLDVTVHDGEVSLYGTVAERRQKYLAVWLADGVSGVRDVHTRIRVDPTVDLDTGPEPVAEDPEAGRFTVS